MNQKKKANKNSLNKRERLHTEDQYASVVKELEDIKYALDQSAIVAITDQKGTIQYANDTFCEISKYTREELIGQNHRLLNSRHHPKQFFQNMWKKISAGETWQGEIKNKAKDGTYYWVHTTIVPFLNEKGRPYQYVSIRNDMTERKRAEQRNYHLAYHDMLTNLPNRRLFLKELRNAVHEADPAVTKFAVMFIDLDKFKYVNDSWGHETGDLILTAAGRRIQDAIPSTDVVGRLGGDEFAVIAANIQSKQDAAKRAEQIVQKMEEPMDVAGRNYVLSCSIGIALYPNDSMVEDELLSKADTALYEIKSNVRKRFIFFTEDMEQKSLERIMLENELKKAIKQNQFHLDYQPKVDLARQKLVGLEALVRWSHPDLGIIQPRQFIPIAEETGLIVPLGKLILKQACLQNKEWQNKGYSPLKMAVNISPQQLAQPDFLNTVKEVLQETKLDPKWLELEVTESVIINMNKSIQLLNAIKEIGVQISIDDFGTGYSSFSYIKQLPVDTLKIDMSFIQDINENKESKAIVQAILTLAKSLNIQVLAEGIENEEQLKTLNQEGCMHGQGFLLGKPLANEKLERLLRDFK
ncbi:putative bifunctional diguanylate cyclase/phosphodiesterase [Virgibacillus sp. W0430]|uniref:putative bifunctional diguanylate cyclase/phosphodiesterase n=1 Tax=Virgibacillus sp. W0430 TaxID=3391580 RepID=UPI003F470F0F